MGAEALVLTGLQGFTRVLAQYADDEGANEILAAAVGLNVVLGALHQDSEARCAAHLEAIRSELRQQGTTVRAVDRKIDVLLGGELRTAVRGLREVGQISPGGLPRHLNRLADQFSVSVMRTLDLWRVHERRQQDDREQKERFNNEKRRRESGFFGFFREMIDGDETYESTYPEAPVVEAQLKCHLRQAAFGTAATHALLGNSVSYQYALLVLVPIEWEASRGGQFLDEELTEINEDLEGWEELWQIMLESASDDESRKEMKSEVQKQRGEAAKLRRDVAKRRRLWKKDPFALLDEECLRLRESLTKMTPKEVGLQRLVEQYDRCVGGGASWADAQEEFLTYLSKLVPNITDKTVTTQAGESCSVQHSLDERLIKLKKLYDRGLIDTETYRDRVSTLLSEQGL